MIYWLPIVAAFTCNLYRYAKAEEEQRRKLEGVPTLDEEAFPDREEARKVRFKYEQENTPLAERLWAMRNSAAQLAQSGARAQARSMLEEAYTLRAESIAKFRAQAEEAQKKKRRGGAAAGEAGKAVPRGLSPQLLPELLALEDCFAREAAWSGELAGVRGQVLKAVRSAAEQAAAGDDWLRAAALLEGAAREYGGDRKLGSEHPVVLATAAAAVEAWAEAGVAQGDEVGRCTLNSTDPPPPLLIG